MHVIERAKHQSFVHYCLVQIADCNEQIFHVQSVIQLHRDLLRENCAAIGHGLTERGCCVVCGTAHVTEGAPAIPEQKEED